MKRFMVYVTYSDGSKGKILLDATDTAHLFNRLMACRIAKVDRVDVYVGMLNG